MTRFQFVRHSCAALFIGLTALLSACVGGGGGDDNGNASVRVINATSDLSSVDVYLGTTNSFPNNTTDTLGSYASVGAGTYDIKITSSGNTTSLLGNTYTFAKNQHYTAVVWGRSGALSMATVPEDEDTSLITSGNSAVRLYNATSNTGSLDVFLTQAGNDDLSNATPTISAIGSGALSGFRQLQAGDWRLRVTGAGNINDLRLDIPLTLSAGNFQTLVVTAGNGGVLVNGALLVQQGAVTQLKNTQSRVRVLASAEQRAAVAVQMDGSTISTLRSPNVGPYVLVNAGAHVFNVLLDGVSVSNASQTLAPGSDYTLIGYGSAGAGLSKLFADDNRLPAAGYYRIRLINGIAGSDPLSLSVDYAVLVSDIPPGASSVPITASSTATTTTRHIEVQSTSGLASIYSADPFLQSVGVYTVVLLGGNVDSTSNLPVPTGVLIKDR